MTPRGAKKRWLDEVAISWRGDECLDFPFPLDPRGYGNFQDANRRTTMAHIYVCGMVKGEKPSASMEVAHSCGRSKCVNPLHLRWDTHKGNEADKMLHGSHNRGERQGASKLTAEGVANILARIELGECQRRLAAEFSVSEQQISNIKTGRRWAWL